MINFAYFQTCTKIPKKSSKKGQKLQSRDKIPIRERTENQIWGNRNRQQWRTQKIFIGGFILWHMVAICIWCALFVLSQFDVIFTFPYQRLGEVC